MWDELLNEDYEFDGPGYKQYVRPLVCRHLLADYCEIVECPEYWEGELPIWELSQHDCKLCE